MTSDSHESGLTAGGGRQRVEKLVSQLILLSRSEEACRLLGVDGLLADVVDLNVLDDPLGYLSHDIAGAIHDSDGEAAPDGPTKLAPLVAELRLCGLIVAHLDQFDLVERVLGQLAEGDE